MLPFRPRARAPETRWPSRGDAAPRPAALTLALAATLTLASPFLAPSAAEAQGSPASAADSAPPGPAVGALAPDFSLTGATRYGLLRAPVRLSDYRGQTVVLAFFYKARTKG